MLASSFSGFTVVGKGFLYYIHQSNQLQYLSIYLYIISIGIPNEVYAMGWTSLKWVAIQVAIMITWSGAGLRREYIRLLLSYYIHVTEIISIQYVNVSS